MEIRGLRWGDQDWVPPRACSEWSGGSWTGLVLNEVVEPVWGLI
jgi:hypothetical protein